VRIAIVAPSPIPFGPGGAESVWAGLYHELLTGSSHDVELIKVPVRETTLPEVMAAYESFTSLDLSHFDMVITGKYPAWMVNHPRHVVYMLHPLRGLYDGYRLFGLPLVETSPEPLIRRLIARSASLNTGSMPEFFQAWRSSLDTLGPSHPALAFPSPLARTLVHAMDRVALRPGAVSRYLAISKTVAERADYFPVGVPVQIVHPPSDLAGLHELPGEYFFTASRHDAPKRLGLLLEGMRHYSGRRRLVIAGTGPETERLREIAAPDPRVEFVGRVSKAQLADHYARAVGVPFIPLEEDLGLITFEAMRSGKPVLTACDSGGPTEFVVPGVNGVVVTPTPAGIGEGLHRLERLGGSPRVAEAARLTVQDTRWSRVVEELVRAPAAEHATGAASSGRPRLVVMSTFPIWPPHGGGQLRAYHLYGALTDTFDVELISLAAPAVPPSTRELRPGMIERVVPRTEAHDTEELKIGLEVGIPVTDIVAGRLMRLTPDYLTVLSAALVGAAGVILAHPFLYPVVAAAGCDVPIVYDAHNCEFVLKSQMLPDTPAGKRLLEEVRHAEAGASQHSALVLSVSAEDSQNLQTLYGTPNDRLSVVPNGVDLPRVPFTPIAVRQRNRERWLEALRRRGAGRGLTSLATFIGSWHPPNNEAARSIVEIARSLPEVGFLLVGSHTGSLRHMPIPANVFLLGEVSDAVKTTVLSTVDVALAPLMTGSGTNLKVVEYLAAGIPVVSTPVGMRGLHVPQECVRVATIATFGAAIRRELAEVDTALERTIIGRRVVELAYDWHELGSLLIPRVERALEQAALSDRTLGEEVVGSQRMSGLEQALNLAPIVDPTLGEVDDTRNASYDEQTIQIIARSVRPGDTCIDVGAHVGDVLRHMVAASVARHLAFEPLPELAAGLRRDFPSVDVHEVALSTEDGSVSFQRVATNPAYSGLLLRHLDREGERVETITVRTGRLDDLADPSVPIRLIKIDVEGAELGVLKGGAETIQRDRPLIVFEHGMGAAEVYGTRPQDIFDLFDGWGYGLTTMDSWLSALPVIFSRSDFVEQFERGINYYFMATPASSVSSS
jgi:FkbM family methyltransferase